MRLTARSRLPTYASVSRVQSDEEMYDLERTVVGSVVAGVTADRCGQCGACDRGVVPVAVGNRKTSDMAITEAAYAESQMEIERLRTALENQRRECDRAWREVDVIARERDDHLRWRGWLADKLHKVEGATPPERTVTLPPLPPPGITTAMVVPENEPRRLWGAYYTASQMRNYATECLRAAGVGVRDE